MCDLARTHWCMQVEVFLEIATLDISMPIAVVLDGGATVFPTSMTVDFLPEVRRLVAGHRRTVLCQRERTWQHQGRLLRTGLAPPLLVWRVDSGDDELVNIVTPLLGC
jgi:hypothetical protein